MSVFKTLIILHAVGGAHRCSPMNGDRGNLVKLKKEKSVQAAPGIQRLRLEIDKTV